MIAPGRLQVFTHEKWKHAHRSAGTADVHGSFIYSSQRLEANQMTISQWMDQPVWSIHTIAQNRMNYSDTRLHEWVSVMPRERNQTKMKHAVWCHLYKGLEDANESTVMESRLVVTRVWGRIAGGKDYKEQKKTFGGCSHIHDLDCGDGFTGVYLCQNLSNYTL